MRRLAYVPLAFVPWTWCVLLADAPARLKHDEPASLPRPAWVKMVDQGRTNPRLKGYFTPDGIKVEIVAEEPVVVNPVGMTFDADGTFYVLEWVHVDKGQASQAEVTLLFKDGTRRMLTVRKKPIKDRVKVLRDSKGKGTYDQARVVLQEELPSGILIHDGWMYLTGQGTVRRYRMADVATYAAPQAPTPTDPRLSKADAQRPRPQIVAQGFGGLGQRQVSGLTLGNDGWLYISCGAGDNFVEGADGSRAVVLRTGAVFRCRPDGTKIQTYAQGFRNPYRDVACDVVGNLFHVDNGGADGPGRTACRLLHVAEGCDFGWRLPVAAKELHPAAAGARPGTLPPMLQTGAGSPAGLLSYNDTRFPATYRGLLLYPDGQRQLIRAYRLAPKDGTFAVVEEFALMQSSDPLFRPCQMVAGPDGALYVCDGQTNLDGAGPLAGGGKHGRIYRLSWVGPGPAGAAPPAGRSMDHWARISKMSMDDLLKTLVAADFTDRQRAREELTGRAGRKEVDAKKAVPALVKLVQNGQEPLVGRSAALEALQAFWDPQVAEVFVAMLQDPNPDLRRLGADGLAQNTPAGNQDVHEALVQALADDDPAVRRAVILAIGHVAAAGSADVLASALQFDEGKYAYLHDGILHAIENVGRPAIDKVLALADSGLVKDRDTAVAAFLAFHTRPAVEALPALLKNVHLTNGQKADLLRSYRNYLLDPPISLEPVAHFLADLPRPPRGVKVSAQEAAELKALTATKLAGLEVLASGGRLQGPRAQGLLVAMLDETDPAVRIAAIQTIAMTRLAAARPRLLQMQSQVPPSSAEGAAVAQALAALRK